MSLRAEVERHRAALAEHAAAWYPRECCALMFRDAHGDLGLTLVDNLADRYHALDPEAYPRDARTAYVIDVRVLVEAERQGRELVAVVHSHVDVGAYFSAEDARLATLDLDGRPAPSHPGVGYVVLDVRRGALVGFEVFVWSDTAETFTRAPP